MGPITTIIPAPRSVPCAGHRFEVAEFTLRDLATLQSCLDTLDPDPLFAVQDSLAGMDAPQRARTLAQAYELAERGAPVYGESSGSEFFSTPEGAALFLWVALRRRNDVSPERAAELFRGCTRAEYSQIWRICHGTTTRRALERMLLEDVPEAHDSSVRRKSWPEMIVEFAGNWPGWKLSDVYDLTITEWVLCRNSGQFPENERRVAFDPEQMRAIGEAQRRKFYGISDPSAASDTEASSPTPPSANPRESTPGSSDQ